MTLALASFFIITLFIPTAWAADSYVAENSAQLDTEVFGIVPKDSRAEKLENFLKNYRSPLVDYAAFFVEEADKYQIDWRLVPAITGVESTFGKQIPYNSYNAYGWANGAYRFKSWEDSIAHVTKTLREKYFDRGLDTPYKIGPVYAPPSKTWAGKVVYFMEKISARSGQANSPDSLELTI